RRVPADDRARAGAAGALPRGAPPPQAGGRAPRRLPRPPGPAEPRARQTLADLRRRAPAALRPRNGTRAARARRLRAGRGAPARQPLSAPLLAAAGAATGAAGAARGDSAQRSRREPLGGRLSQRVDD